MAKIGRINVGIAHVHNMSATAAEKGKAAETGDEGTVAPASTFFYCVWLVRYPRTVFGRFRLQYIVCQSVETTLVSLLNTMIRIFFILIELC